MQLSDIFNPVTFGQQFRSKNPLQIDQVQLAAFGQEYMGEIKISVPQTAIVKTFGKIGKTVYKLASFFMIFRRYGPAKTIGKLSL